MSQTIELVTEADLADLLPLLRGYLDFYAADPLDDDVLALSRALLADPEREGIQLIGRDADGRALGFATIFWTWSTLSAARIAVMNDLFVHPERARDRARRRTDRGLRRTLSRAWRHRPSRLADRQGQPPRAEGLRAGRRQARGVGRLLDRHVAAPALEVVALGLGERVDLHVQGRQLEPRDLVVDRARHVQYSRRERIP